MWGLYAPAVGEPHLLLERDGHVATVTLNVVPLLSINDKAITEGNSGTKNITFTVSLSGPAAGPTSVQFLRSTVVPNSADRSPRKKSSGARRCTANDGSPGQLPANRPPSSRLARRASTASSCRTGHWCACRRPS